MVKIMKTADMTTRNELAWLANGYVLGELSAEEAAAFEVRLEADLEACDAVARVMELNLAVAAAFDQQTSQPVALPVRESVAPNRWAGVAVSALAASAVAVASVALMLGHSDSTTNGNSVFNGMSRKDKAARLVAVWASGEAVRNSTADDELLDAIDDFDLDPPDWMLAALTVEGANKQLPGNDAVREN